MKRNLLLLLICLSLGGVTYFAYKNKKAKEVANIKRILKLDEHAVFKWEIHYDDVHLICEKKSPQPMESLQPTCLTTCHASGQMKNPQQIIKAPITL